MEKTTIDDAEVVNNPTDSEGQQAVPNFFNPLSEEIKERAYSTPDYDQNAKEIPEPEFKGALNSEEIENQEEKPEEPRWQDKITNEGVNQLDGKEKKIACEQLVDTCLDGYEMLHGFALKYAKFDEAKLIKSIQDGEINPEVEMPIDEHGTTTNPVEFIEQYNESVDEAIKYDKEFGVKVRPAMIRVFEKKGWGMNDEQYLMYMFGKDLAVKATMVYGLKKQSSMIFNTFIELSKQRGQAEMEAPEPVKPDIIKSPPKEEKINIKKEIFETETREYEINGNEVEVDAKTEIDEVVKAKKKRGRPKKVQTPTEVQDDLDKQ